VGALLVVVGIVQVHLAGVVEGLLAETELSLVIGSLGLLVGVELGVSLGFLVNPIQGLLPEHFFGPRLTQLLR